MPKPPNHYFDNERVEQLLTRYVDGACTDRQLRDEVMEHALPLIYAVIRSKGLARLMHARSADTEDELASVAWQQIEKTLYKFEPGRAKVFSMWSQVAYLACLAYIKKETRDACVVREWEEGKPIPRAIRSIDEERGVTDFYAEMADLREAFRGSDIHQEIVDFLVELYETREHPWVGLSGALGKRFGREAAREFLGSVQSHGRAPDDRK